MSQGCFLESGSVKLFFPNLRSMTMTSNIYFADGRFSSMKPTPDFTKGHNTFRLHWICNILINYVQLQRLHIGLKTCSLWLYSSNFFWNWKTEMKVAWIYKWKFRFERVDLIYSVTQVKMEKTRQNKSGKKNSGIFKQDFGKLKFWRQKSILIILRVRNSLSDCYFLLKKTINL